MKKERLAIWRYLEIIVFIPLILPKCNSEWESGGGTPQETLIGDPDRLHKNQLLPPELLPFPLNVG